MQASNSSKQSFEPGSVVSLAGEEFEIIEELGRGGMGCVYKAMRRSLQRLVAIKFVFDAEDTQGTQRFIREAKLMAAVSHPNIVRVDAVKAEGTPFIVMELVEGRTLSEVLAEKNKLSQSEFVAYFSQLLSALQYLHDQGLVHRDIKPSNIMVTTGDTIKLMDFGIAKDLSGQRTTSQSMTRTGAIVGSPWYMSPEQCRAEQLDARSDLYSVGCVMYEALTGKPPFEGENALEVMYAHINSQVSTENELALPAFSQLVMKAMEKEPEKRFQTAAEMREMLTLKEAATQSSRRGRSQRKSSHKPLIPILSALAVLVAGIAAVLYFHPTDGPQSISLSEDSQSAHSLYDKGRESEHLSWDEGLSQTERENYRNLAISQYKEALNHNPNEKVEYDCNAHVSALLRAMDPKQGEENANRALAVIKQYRFNKAEYLNAMEAVLHYKRVHQDWKSVIELCQEKIRERPTPLVLRALDTVQLAGAYEQTKETAKVDALLQQMLQEGEKEHDKHAIGVTACAYATHQQMRGHFPESCKYAQLAVESLKDAKPNSYIGKLTLRDTFIHSETTWAQALEQAGQYEEARKVTEAAISDIEQRRDEMVQPSFRLCDLYAGLCRYYERKKDPRFFAVSDKTIEYCVKSKHAAGTIPIFNSRFWNECARGNIKGAKDVAHKMLEFGLQNPNKYVRAWAFALAGRADLITGDLDSARRRLERAERLAKEELSQGAQHPDFTDLWLMIYTPRAQTEMRSGDGAQAAHYARLAHNAAQQANAMPALAKEAADTFDSYQKSLAH